MNHKIQTDVVIFATEKEVWDVLMDFSAYPEWNPFIKSISGLALEQAILEVKVQPPGVKKPSLFKPTVQKVVEKQHFSWKGSLPIPGLFTGVHSFEIQHHPSGVRFSQCETFSGLLVPLLKGMLKKTEEGFGLMNQALKDRAETGQGLPSKKKPRVDVGVSIVAD